MNELENPYTPFSYLGIVDDELMELAKLCQITKDNPFGRCYDDEVFDEIERRDI